MNNFNYAAYLGAAIDSALRQTYTPKQIIVIDDGSTDRSRDIIEEYGNLVEAVFKPNGGQASTYNEGFRHSRGQLVLFLDADDMLLPTAIEEAVALWNPTVAKVQFYLRVVEGVEAKPTDIVVPTSKLAAGDLKNQTVTTGHYSSPPATGNLYSRHSLESILPMPEPEWVVAADTYPIFLAPFFGEIRACETALGLYRVHGKNQDAQTLVTADLLRYRLKKERQRDELLAKFCEPHGYQYRKGAVENQIGHLKIRLASILLDRKNHPYQSDRLLPLAWRAIRTTWSTPGEKLAKKAIVTAWVLSAVATPRNLKTRVIELGFVPTKRPPLLSRLLGPAGTHARLSNQVE